MGDVRYFDEKVERLLGNRKRSERVVVLGEHRETDLTPDSCMMGKKKEIGSAFFRENNLIHRIDRKHWNKAVSLIDTSQRRAPMQNNFCCRTGPASRLNPRIQNNPSATPFLLIEIRQALLRHDWSTVCRLYECLLDTFQNYRIVCNKMLMVLLLSSPASDSQIFKDFCRMALGIDGDEIDVFLKTLCSLPKKIPRGYVQSVVDKLYVKKESGQEIADSYLKASQKHRTENANT